MGRWVNSPIFQFQVFCELGFEQEGFDPSKIKWDVTNGHPKEVARGIRYSSLGIGYSSLGVRSVGPVGDFLEFEGLGNS